MDLFYYFFFIKGFYKENKDSILVVVTCLVGLHCGHIIVHFKVSEMLQLRLIVMSCYVVQLAAEANWGSIVKSSMILNIYASE